MRTEKLDSMIRGWFIGNFTPTLYNTNDVEIAVKQYRAGDVEKAHYHKIATEFTVVVAGRVRMDGIEHIQGDIIVVEPGDVMDFEALEDSINVVVKIPGVNNDKYVVEEV